MKNWLAKFFKSFKEGQSTVQVEQNVDLENDINVYKFKLNSYNEVVYVAKILIKKEKVLINLNDLEKNERRRILDFLSGVIFFQNGNVKKIKNHIYLFVVVTRN